MFSQSQIVGAKGEDKFDDWPWSCEYDLEDEGINSAVYINKMPYSSPVDWELLHCMLIDIKDSTYFWIDRPENVPSIDFVWKKGRFHVKGSLTNKIRARENRLTNIATTQYQTT